MQHQIIYIHSTHSTSNHETLDHGMQHQTRLSTSRPRTARTGKHRAVHVNVTVVCSCRLYTGLDWQCATGTLLVVVVVEVECGIGHLLPSFSCRWMETCMGRHCRFMYLSTTVSSEYSLRNRIRQDIIHPLHCPYSVVAISVDVQWNVLHSCHIEEALVWRIHTVYCGICGLRPYHHHEPPPPRHTHTLHLLPVFICIAVLCTCMIFLDVHHVYIMIFLDVFSLVNVCVCVCMSMWMFVCVRVGKSECKRMISLKLW